MPDLIALADLRTITGLNDLVEARKVANGITAAHLQVEKVLGRAGYAIIYAGAPSFTGDTTGLAALLTGYIKPFMAWKAKQLAYPDMYAEADRAGVFTKSGDDYSSVSGRDMSLLISQAQSMADEYQQRLVSHLEANTSVWAWYNTTAAGERRMPTDRNGGSFSFRRSERQEYDRG